MTKNPFSGMETEAPRRKTQQELVDYGNDHLVSIGRFDVYWFVHNGRCTIGHRDTSPVWPDRRLGTDATR